MSLQLPPAALRKLEQTLAQWRHWQDGGELPGAPHLVGQLGGISNYTVLAEAAGQRFCIRLDRVNPAANSLNRQVEWHALHSAHAAGLAPRPRYFNPEIGALVCDYLSPDEDQSVSPADLAGLLRGIHRLPHLHFRLDLPERIRRYRRQLKVSRPGILDELDRAVARLLAGQDAGPAHSRLCHNDISAGNLLRSGGRLYALDWEYCAMGNPWLDLGTCTSNALPATGQEEEMLQHYLQRPVRDDDRRALQAWRCVADYLTLLWYLSQRPDCHDPQSTPERAAEILERLERLSRGSW